MGFAALTQGCQPVSNGPKPTLFMPPTEEQDVFEGFAPALQLTMVVEQAALRRPPIRETVDAQIAAMTAYVRRHGRGLAEATPQNADAGANTAVEHAARLAETGTRLLAYLPMDAETEVLARASVAALAKSLGDDAELHLGDPFAAEGAADISAGVFNRIAVLRLRHLGGDMNDRALNVLTQWSGAAEPPRALVLDLSECIGGGAKAATSLVNALAPGKPVFQVAYRNPETNRIERRTWRGEEGWGNTSFAKTPVYVLASRRTVGVAEAVAHALRAYRSAHVIGQSTAGTGRITSWHSLPWDAWFCFTVADLLGPDGASLRGKPVIPDTCATPGGLSPLGERNMDRYRALCPEERFPELEEVLAYVETALAVPSGPTP